MDLLDRLLGHDTWTTRQLLLCCWSLTDEQLDREFDIVRTLLVPAIATILGRWNWWPSKK